MKQKEVHWVAVPYSDFAHVKQRPALVVSNDGYNKESEDVLACAVTSNLQPRPYSLSLEQKDFAEGILPLKSRVCCDKLFSIQKTFFTKKMGALTDKTFLSVAREISRLIKPRE